MKKTNFTFLKGFAMSTLMAVGVANVNAQSIVCQDHVNVSLAADCSINLTPATFLAVGQVGTTVTIKNGQSMIATGTSITSMAGLSVGSTYTFEVMNAGGNKCWGTVKFEDKSAPVVTCGPALNVPCTFVFKTAATAYAAGGALETGVTAATDADCSTIASRTYSDDVSGDLCLGTLKATRTYKVTDKWGNVGTCAQVLTVTKQDILAVTFPANQDLSKCVANYPADFLPGTGAGVTGVAGGDTWAWPISGGAAVVGSSSGYCNLSATYTDKVANLCGGGKKVVRVWVVVDFCGGAIATSTPAQILTVKDTTAPTITAPASIAVNTSVMNCLADQLIAFPTNADNCGVDTRTVTVSGMTFVADAAGKVRITGLTIGNHVATWKVTDACGNVGTATSTLVVADKIAPTAVCDLNTKVALSQECVAVVNASTFDDGSTDNCCIDLNSFSVVRTADYAGLLATWQAPTSTAAAAEAARVKLFESKQITFNKADCAAPVMVTMIVADCYGNWNACMVVVEVEDKIAPVAFGDIVTVCCGSNTTASAFLNAYILPKKDLVDFPSATNPGYYDNCGATTARAQTGNIDNCGNGTVVHTWTITDEKNKSVASTRVEYRSENRSAYTVEFPDDKEIFCGDNAAATTATAAGAGVPTVVAFDKTCPLVGIESTDEIFDIVDGSACYKIIRTWKVLNWCQNAIPGVNANANTGQGIDLVTNSRPSPVTGARKFANIWENRPNSLGSVYTTGVPCAADMGNIRTNLDGRENFLGGRGDGFANVDKDGYMEYKQIIKVSDKVAPTIKAGVITQAGVTKQCEVKVTIGAAEADDCSKVTATTYSMFNNTTGVVVSSGVSGSFTATKAQFGNYTVRYTATDKCGNYASTDVAVLLKDQEKPRPLCFQGLAVDVMPTTGEAWLVAKVFDAGSEDNCTEKSKLTFRIQSPAAGAGASYDPAKALPMIAFKCIGLQTVSLWVGDEAGNWDYCDTYVDVQNNMGAVGVPACAPITPTGSKVAGTVKTEAGNPAKAQVSFIATGFPSAIKKWTSAGNYGDFFAPANANVTVSAENNTNPLNGVSTLDLVMISKHILGTQTINSAYGKIAADVNNSGTITTSDLVELRKMILGIQTGFTKNSSWRFFDANMAENVAINAIATDKLVNFTAVKIGDINGNADAALAAGRSTVEFTAANASLTAGQEVKVVLNNATAEGFQFALNYDASAVEVVSVDENSAVIENGTITTSQVGTAFEVTFKAKKNTQLSNVISLGTAINNEAVVNGTSANVAINFNNTVAGFELFQNQPNPFRGSSVVSFSTPVAGAYTLTITDMAGRTVQSISNDAVKGLNNVTVELSNAGVFNYTVKTSNFTATKKMVVIE